MGSGNILHNPINAAKILNMTCDTLLLLQNDGTCVDIILRTSNPYINESDSLKGKNIFEVFPESTVKEFRPEFDRVIASGEESNRNYDLPASDKMYYFKCIMYKYDALHVLCQYRDITQRSQMKRRLQTAIITLQEVERAARISHWSFNTGTNLLEYFGYNQIINWEDSISYSMSLDDVLSMVHPEERESILLYLKRTDNVGRECVCRIIRDRVKYIRCKIINERIENGFRVVEGYAQNISDMVERRNEMEMVLSVIDNSPESIYANKLDGTLVFANKLCRRQNHIPIDIDVMQYKAYEILANVHSKKMWDGFVENFKSNNNFSHHVCHELYPQFDIIASDCTSYIVKNGIGEDIIWSFMRDISAQLRYEEGLKYEKDLAEESDRLKTAFISNMSHEIRTPLNAIVGFSSMIAQTDDVVERKEYYKIVQSNSNQLLRLVNEVLDLSRMESGRVSFDIQPISLNDIGEELEASHGLRCATIKLYFDRPESDFLLHTDRGRLMQILSNLIVNAIKFTSKGSIHFGYAMRDKLVEFYVADTGIGINAEHLDKVFDRFVKINDFDQGTGLGLAICKTIVEKMGGQISVESVINKGTTFRFSLPIKTNIE
jgi:two-component sensor histidine kinase